MREAYKRIKKAYKEIMLSNDRKKYNPNKIHFNRKENDNVVTAITNIMSAKTENGIFTKVISLDDITNQSSEEIIYVQNDGKVFKANSLNLTVIRCALMACLSIELCLGFENVYQVGFIGDGKINLKTCELIRDFVGVTNFVVRGKQEGKINNLEKFQKYGNIIIDENYELLNKCDVVICCTNSCDENDVIQNILLKDVPLIISQDGGYILGESFRKERENFTDCVEQLKENYHEEFPYDKKKHKLNYMKQIRNKKNKAVWLYGIALADALLYERILELCK